MVAVLDPRLLKTGAFSYPTQTRALYMRTLEAFTSKAADLRKAEAFLGGLGGGAVLPAKSTSRAEAS